MHIQGSVVFITGANRGLGLSFAREALARGARKVYAGMRNTEGFDIPGMVPVKLDVTDAASVAAAAALCGDTTVLINNAGIAKLMDGALDDRMIELSRELLETNYYGVVRVTQAFAPILLGNGGGAVINVLSDASWQPSQLLPAYAVTKAAAWSFSNSLRLQLKDQNVQVLNLHVGFLDTDLTKGFDMPKSDPNIVAGLTLDELIAGKQEVMGDKGTQALKNGLSLLAASYLVS
ncbi:MAG: SDR family oxidoreductase [Pseudomonadota bacterium]